MLSTSLIFLLVLSSQAQSQFGIKFGLSSYDLPSDMLELNSQDVKISIENANYGVHFGTYLRIGLFGFFLQPELNFNSNSVEYRITDISSGTAIDDIRTVTYQNIDIPVLLMFSPSIFRLYAGPVGHYLLNSSSELSSIDGLKEEFKTLTYGYQAGLGLQISSIGLDVRYEGNFNKFGDQIIIDGQPISFSDSPARILFSITLKI